MATLKDRVIIGAISGIAAILIRDLYSLLAQSIGIAKFGIWHLGASLFLNEASDVKGLGGIVIGIPADIVMGALFGVVFVYFLKWTGDLNPILKGWVLGLSAWLLLYGLIWHNLPTIQSNGKPVPGDVLSNLSALIGHSIFGIVLGIVAWILLKWQGLVESGGSDKTGKGGNGAPKGEDDKDKHGIAAPKAPSSV